VTDPGHAPSLDVPPSRATEAWSNGGFRRLATASITSTFGDQVAGIGYLLIGYEVTGSKFLTTLIVVAEVSPYLLFGLVGGALSSVVDRRRLMVTVDAVRLAIQVLLAVLAAAGLLDVAVLLVSIFALETGGCVFNPSSRAALIDVVATEQLARANSLLSVGQNVSALVAPAVAAGVVALHANWLFFTLNGATYLVSALALLSMGDRLRSHAPRALVGGIGRLTTDLWGEIRAFVTFAASSRVLRVLFVTEFLCVVFNTWAWSVGILFKLAPHAHSDKTAYTVMLAVYAVAGILASVIFGRYSRRPGMGVYVAGVLAWGVGLSLIATTRSLPVVAAAVAVLGIGLTVASLSRVYLTQTLAPLRHIGQAFSTAAVLLYAGDLVSLGGFGTASDRLSLNLLFLVAGGGVVASGLGALIVSLWQARRASS
jgi:MFS family permease